MEKNSLNQLPISHTQRKISNPILQTETFIPCLPCILNNEVCWWIKYGWMRVSSTFFYGPPKINNGWQCLHSSIFKTLTSLNGCILSWSSVYTPTRKKMMTVIVRMTQCIPEPHLLMFQTIQTADKHKLKQLVYNELHGRFSTVHIVQFPPRRRRTRWRVDSFWML